MNIGEKLRKIRTLKGYSQEYMASSQVAYSSIENNKTDLGLKKLRAIGEIFEMDINAIIAFDGNQLFNPVPENKPKDFSTMEQTINKAFENERKAYLDEIEFLKSELEILRNKLNKK